MRKYTLLIILALVFILGCGNSGDSPKPGPGNPNGNMMKKVPVIVKEIKPETLHRYIYITGKLEGKTDIVLSSETSGKVVEIYKKLGDWVNKGEEIGKIDNIYYKIKVEQAKANLMSAEAAYELASIQMGAADQLYSQGKISQAEYVQATSNLKKSQSAINDAKANLELAEKNFEYSRFISPVSGYITNLNIKIGEMISVGKPICSIVDTKTLLIKTGISESEVSFVKKGQEVLVNYRPLGKTVAGKITGIGIKPINGAGNYPIEIELPNKDGELYPGMVIEAKILSKIYENVIFTSINDLREEYDRYYAFVIIDKDKSKRVEVKLGDKVEENVIILEGLSEGDRLVTEGIENLDDGQVVEIRKGLE
mgnify:CR=1 FL=1